MVELVNEKGRARVHTYAFVEKKTGEMSAHDLEDVSGTASLLNGPNDVAFELPFVMQGPWDNTFPIPDPAILIKRSGAAAPLLDAVRDKKTQDSIRSAIERLTGPRPAAEAAPTTATAPPGR